MPPLVVGLINVGFTFFFFFFFAFPEFRYTLYDDEAPLIRRSNSLGGGGGGGGAGRSPRSPRSVSVWTDMHSQ